MHLLRCKPRQGQPALPFDLRLASARFNARRVTIALFRGALNQHAGGDTLCTSINKLQSHITQYTKFGFILTALRCFHTPQSTGYHDLARLNLPANIDNLVG